MKSSAPVDPSKVQKKHASVSSVDTKPNQVPQEKKKPLTDDLNKKTEKKVKRVYKVGASDEQNAWIMYAYERCGIDCVRTFEAESGWRIDVVSKANRNGTRDHGACQLNSQYHKKFINSPDFQDPYKQLDYCIGVWNDAIKKGRMKTTFYGYNVRNTTGPMRNIQIEYHN